jgi:fumarate hydratase class II
MATTRTEHDALGPVEVPAERLWGAQTQRSLENFRISGERMPLAVIRAITLCKRAAAQVNRDLGTLPPTLAGAIITACDEVLAGRHDAEFPLSVWQTGSGTQSHMNVNEVLASRASELLGGSRGQGRPVHPNDHVNRSQSSNDVFPAAMNLAALMALKDDLLPALRGLRQAFAEKAEAFADLVKIGRTHLQDATPLTLGQELSGYVSQLDHAAARIESSLGHLGEMALGGTAVGTGLNAPAAYAEKVTAELSRLTGRTLVSASSKFEALAAHDALVAAHAQLRGLAVALMKIAGDLRLLGSGPRSGLGELRLPENEPGSSIMPGKVNPTQVEALTMLSCQVMGNDVAVATAGAMGQLELNAFKPVIIHNVLQSIRLLADGCRSFEAHCVRGLEADRQRIADLVASSLMLVTALVPHLGYEAAARIARHAHATGQTLRQAALELGLVSAADFDAWVRPEQMVGPAR